MWGFIVIIVAVVAIAVEELIRYSTLVSKFRDLNEKFLQDIEEVVDSMKDIR